MWRKFNLWLALILCAALASLAAACKAGDGAGASRAGAGATSTTTTTTTAGATPHPTSTPNDGVRRVTTDEARALVERGEALIVDVRAQAQYDQGHIKGAVCVPRTEIDKRLAQLPKDKLLIFYCA
ncbi:MAG TPA: rhodanese-like domain-containing protein [Pyrinomonadaceae bacterium]|jgi:3-mercaptopyruvate sulfurtransferase SseA|nr:rhodanese-like domain-containing protein [Pyrinomonadaceae bacterium]